MRKTGNCPTLIAVLRTAAFVRYVFYLSYLRNELLRRKGRTILTLLGLALGVALVIVITSLSRGLDQAQKTALDPLSSIGTDLTVTVEPSGPGGGAFANGVIQTDLSQLGDPGDHFERDSFSSGSQSPFSASEAKAVAGLEGVEQVATGLTLTVQHQKGKIPKITAEFKTGGDTYRIQGQTKPPSAADLRKMADCMAKLETSSGSNASTTTGPDRSASQNGAPLAATGDPETLRKCMPASIREYTRTFRTPEETLRKQVKTPQTDIETFSYTIAGVDVSQSEMGLITPGQLTKGRFLSESGDREALVSTSFASANKLKVGSKLKISDVKPRVIGLVQAPLGGQTADVYIPLKELQTLSGQKDQINVVLVRAADSSSVGDVQKRIEKAFPGAEVASAQDVADQISGSLVDAADLSESLGLALSIIAVAAAFLLAALLTLSSIAKRTREIGTLRAIGWPRRLVIRQIAGESFLQGIAGGVLGVILGVIAARVIDALGPTLNASSTVGSTTTPRPGFPGGAAEAAQSAVTTTSQVALHAPLAGSIILAGFALAILGGLLAGAAGAFRAAQLRPADALRQVE